MTPSSPVLFRWLVAPALLGGAVTVASGQILTLDFESDTLGARPASVTINTPSPSNVGPSGVGGALSAGDVGLLITNQDNNLGTAGADIAVGSGQVLRLFDSATGSGANDVARFTSPGIVGNFPVSVLSIDFSSTLFTGTTGNSFVHIAWGDSGVNASSSGAVNNMARVTIARSGAATTAVTASNQTSGGLSNGASFASFALQTANNLKIVVSDAESPTSYTIGSVSRLLPANQFEVWLNDTFVGGPFLMRSSLTGGTGSFTNFSFGTGSTQSGPDWLFDNITVSQAIPEPSTFAALAAAAAMGLAWARRRRS